jgi:hypothetical protein
MGYVARTTVTRKRRRAKQFDESAVPEVQLQGKDKFRVETFNVIIDHLTAALGILLTELMPTEMFEQPLQLLLISAKWNQRRCEMRHVI